ncbi:MAG TPA: hypothetical protein VH020_10335 [Stellaceae bacterium]|jgi:hypothetical protein|nr:hypothetical protein [Stellaceae bacterium]
MAADRTTKTRSREERLDDALEDSFPASDPVSVVNPSIGTTRPQDTDDLDHRIRIRAEKLWREAGSPGSGVDSFLDDARTLIAIEDDPKAGTLPNPLSRRDNTGPEGEPIEPTAEVDNLGEFPTLTDQGDQTYPPRRPRAK